MWPWPKEFGIFIGNIIWKFDEEILRNGKDTANVKFSCQNPSTKRGITPSNVNLTLRIWHHLKCVVISNITWKFNEEILSNGKVIANSTFLWWTDRQMNIAISMYCLFFERATQKLIPLTISFLSNTVNPIDMVFISCRSWSDGMDVLADLDLHCLITAISHGVKGS
jgi:hypothetical protein